jgi:hypothetical protein
MTPGQNVVLKTRKGGSLVKIATITSGNTLGARYWTDGKCEAPMLPENPWLRKHPTTGEMFWSNECEEVAEEDPWGEEYADVPFAAAPTLPDYQSALAAGLGDSPKKERYLRTHAWWAANDAVRHDGGGAPDTTADGENLKALVAMLDLGDPNQRLMAAEAWRELGAFDECLELLRFEFPQPYMKAVELIRRLAQERNKKVQPLV